MICISSRGETLTLESYPSPHPPQLPQGTALGAFTAALPHLPPSPFLFLTATPLVLPPPPHHVPLPMFPQPR